MRCSLKCIVKCLFIFTLACVSLLNVYIPNFWIKTYMVAWQHNVHQADLFKPLDFYNGMDNKPQSSSASYQSQDVWFNFSTYNDDRIVAQMNLMPKHIKKFEKEGKSIPFKTILVMNGNAHNAMEYFRNNKCPVNYCTVTTDRRLINRADVVITQHSASRRRIRSPENQIWVLYLLESPNHSTSLDGYRNVYNWTATYRHDSDIVAPYEKFVLYNDSIKTLHQNKNFAKGKTKKIAWFVSNCGASNGRTEYVTELGKYIDVDIYGNCGPYSCPKRKSQGCFDLLNRDYKFYLAFENSNCRDYITEKFFVNGLQHDVIPVVMGAAPEDYARAAPFKSFIHVDDFDSPKHLADYLHILDKNDALFNEYFQWKGTGSFVNTIFWCRLCAMAHEAQFHQPSVYYDVEKWWRGPDVCIGRDTWRSRPRKSPFIVESYRN